MSYQILLDASGSEGFLGRLATWVDGERVSLAGGGVMSQVWRFSCVCVSQNDALAQRKPEAVQTRHIARQLAGRQLTYTQLTT